VNLLFAGLNTLTLADQYQLPLHLFESRGISANLLSFKRIFQETDLLGEVCYAVKACGFPEILSIAARTGAGADVASEHELATALEAGISPEKLVIHGNAKSDVYLKQAMSLDALIAANHHTELDRIEAEAKKLGKTARVLLRLSGFELGPVTAKGIFTAGVWCKFGEPVAEVPALLKVLGKWPHIDLVGFHVHIGSQITELEPYRAVFGAMAELAFLYQEVTGRPVEMIDLGGGFPLSYVDCRTWNSLLKDIQKNAAKFQSQPNPLSSKEKKISDTGPSTKLMALSDSTEPFRQAQGPEPVEGLAEVRPKGFRRNEDRKVFSGLDCPTWEGMTGGFRPDPVTGTIDWKHWSGEKFFSPYPKEKMLARLLAGKVPFQGKEVRVKRVLERIGNPILIVEPGRAIVGDAGITLAKVVDVYPVAGGHPLVTLDLGIVNHGNGLVEPDLYSWTLANDIERKDRRPFKAFVAGRLCFSGDLLSRYRVSFPRRPVPGDIAVIEKTGAYAPTFFASRANGFPIPKFCLIGSDQGVRELTSRVD
jgi:diaminopimelate decarboxylase